MCCMRQYVRRDTLTGLNGEKKTKSQSIILETKMKDLDLRDVVWITDKKLKPRNIQIDNKCLLEQQKIEKLGELLSKYIGD